MSLQKIQFKPGINREGTSLANEGGWFDGDKIRFRSGYPEKIGGWTVATYNRFIGTCRSLWNWITLGQYNLLGMGTHLKFYIENGGVFNDITPIKQTTTNTTTFAVGQGLLTSAIDATQVSIPINFGSGLPVTGGVVLIDYEQIFYGSITSNTLVNCIRGYNGTTAAAHAFSSRVASSIITVTDTTATGVAVGDFVTFSGSTNISAGALLSINSASDVLTVSAVYYQPQTGDTFLLTSYATQPTPLVLNTVYYVINAVRGVSNTTFKLSTSPGGSPINITNGGSTNRCIFNNQTDIVAQVVNQEYQVIGFPASTGSAQPYYIQARGYVDGNVSVSNGAPICFATSSPPYTNGGGAVTAVYQINSGLDTVTVGTGWGAGPWNAGASTDAWAHGWGTGFTSGIALQLRLWNQVNFGERLLFAPRRGTMYVYDPTGGIGSIAPVFNRGVEVTGTEVPEDINFFTVSDATRIVICFGCTSYSFDSPASTYDPLLVRWSEQESYTNWLPSATNQAGSYRLSHGSTIISALQTRQEILVWTDSAIYSMQYLGPPFVFGFTLLADNISIMSQNAMATAAGATYWMGVDKFYAYTGRVETLPCSVRQYVFNDLNRDQSGQVICGTNEGYNEIWWFYCSITGPDGTGTSANPNKFIDSYVIFNHLDRVWYFGKLPRSAWLDSGLRPSPMGTTLDGLLVYHEQGTDDGTTNPPSAITSYVQSSMFDIEDGDQYSFVWRMVPDVTFDGSTTGAPAYPTVNMALIPRQNPGAAPGYAPDPSVTSKQSYAAKYTYKVQQFTEIVYTRVRGRQLTFEISSDTRGSAWQLGVPTIDIRKDGKR